jgi:hypothetical protein
MQKQLGRNDIHVAVSTEAVEDANSVTAAHDSRLQFGNHLQIVTSLERDLRSWKDAV